MSPLARPRADSTRWGIRFENGEISAGPRAWVCDVYAELQRQGRAVHIVFHTQVVGEWRTYYGGAECDD